MKMTDLLPGCTNIASYPSGLTCSAAGYVRDQRSAGIKSPPTDQNDITIPGRKLGKKCDHLADV